MTSSINRTRTLMYFQYHIRSAGPLKQHLSTLGNPKLGHVDPSRAASSPGHSNDLPDLIDPDRRATPAHARNAAQSASNHIHSAGSLKQHLSTISA